MIRDRSVLAADLHAPPHVLWRKMRGEQIVLNTDTGRYFNFQGSGAVIWDLVEELRAGAAIVERAAAYHGVASALIEGDVREFLESLIAQGLLEVEHASVRPPGTPVDGRPPLQIGRAALEVNADLVALRDEFERRHYLSFPQFIEPQLLALIGRYVDAGEFVDRIHQGIGTELCLVPNSATKAMQFLFNDPALLQVVGTIAGGEPLRCFDGRVYRMMARAGHYDSWHSDAGHDRRVAISVNLSPTPYGGGALEIKGASSTEAASTVHNNSFGGAVMFRISRDLRHRVTPVSGSGARTAYAGWFCSSPDYQDKFFAALASH